MTIVTVTEQLEAADFTGQETHNEIVRGWTVKTDGAETEDYEVIDALIANGDIPNAGGAYSGNNVYRARRATCKQMADQDLWFVTVTFDNRTVEYDQNQFDSREVSPNVDVNPADADDPESDPYVVNISDKEEQFPLYVDMDGRSIVSTAGMGIDPVPMGHFTNDVVEITVNSDGPDDLRQANGTINSDLIYIVDDKTSPSMQLYCPPLTALCKVRTSGPHIRRKSDGTAIKYWKNVCTFERRNVLMAKSLFDNNYLQIYRWVSPEYWNRFDSEWASYLVTINGTDYYQLPWGEYLANTGLWRKLTETPLQYSQSNDYEVGDRVWHDPSGVKGRYLCILQNGPGTDYGVQQPNVTSVGFHWRKYAENDQGKRPIRIKMGDVDSDADPDQASAFIETPQWLTSDGDIRRDDANPTNPYIYLWFRTHFALAWLSVSKLPVTSAATTTTS